MILFQIPSLTLHVISLSTKLLPPKFQDVSFVFQMPKQTAISVNFKIPPPSLSFTSLFPHSLKITLLSSPILFTPVYFYRYALYQGNLSIYHSLNFIRSLLLYLLNPLSPLTSLPPQHVSLFPWIISWNDPFLIPSPFSIIRMLSSLFSYFKSASCPF